MIASQSWRVICNGKQPSKLSATPPSRRAVDMFLRVEDWTLLRDTHVSSSGTMSSLSDRSAVCNGKRPLKRLASPRSRRAVNMVSRVKDRQVPCSPLSFPPEKCTYGLGTLQSLALAL